MKNKKTVIKLPKFRAFARLKIEGLNQSRLISKLLKEGIQVKNILRENASILTIDINKKDSKKTFAILQNLCYNYSVVSVSGALSLFRVAATRLGLIIALLVFTTLIALSRGFIWRMEINGRSNVSEQSIEMLLKNHKVGVGKSLKNVDKSALKNALNQTEGVVESSVEVRGTSVIITIIESVAYAPKTPSQELDIVSGYDAQITKIVTLSGTSLVRRGQNVFKGTPLIGAYRISPDEKREKVNASGQVYGNVNITKSITLCVKEYITQESGKTYSNSVIKLFGITIGKNKNPFTSYKSVKEVIYPFDGNFIPIKLEREKIYETKNTLVEHNLQDLINQKTSECVLDNIIKCGGREIKTTTDIKLITENLYKLSVNIQAEMPLC